MADGPDDTGRPAKLKPVVAVPFTIEYPEETWREIERWAESKGVSVEDLFHDAMDAWMVRHGGSPLERARSPFDTGRRPRRRTKTR